MFRVVNATKWRAEEVDEQLGTKEKSWLRNPSNQRWLFKQVRTTAHGQPGEDWAEKIVEQLARRIGLPVAKVELAVRSGRRGIVTENFVPAGDRLEHGNELLVRVDPNYDREQGRSNDRYTVQSVKLALLDSHPPDAYIIEGLTAFDIWAGYLVLDAWVAGRDRHHENWAVIAGHNHRRVLAPSFDHGNALGFQESPERHRNLADDDIQLRKWATRGKSPHFDRKPSLVELAHEALREASENAQNIWLSNLAGVREDETLNIIEQVPQDLMSEPSRTFCQRLLIVNQRRLCDDH